MRLFIFITIIAYGLLITTKDTDHRHDLGVDDQGQIYLDSVLGLLTGTPLSFLTEVLHSLYNDCLLCAYDNIYFRLSI